MQDKTFRFDYDKQSWRECSTPAFCEEDIAVVPMIPIVDYHHQRTGENWLKAWCEVHHAYEEIECYEEDGLTTVAGCHLKGIPVFLTNHVYQTNYNYKKPYSRANVRWQVRHRPGEGRVYADLSSVTFIFTWEKDKTSGEFVAVPTLDSCDVSATALSLKDSLPKNCPNPPYPVLYAILEKLQQEAIALYGNAPKMLTPPKTEDSDDQINTNELPSLFLDAFLHRPLDMSIYFFRKYFKNCPDGDFDTLFPHEQKENFLPLAKALRLEPTDKLRSLYEKNPMAIILRMLLPELGIEREELIQRFDHLQSFCGKTMKKNCFGRLFFDPFRQEGGDVQDNEARDYANLQFYAKWLRQHITEEQLANRLLTAQKKWPKWKFTGLEYFREHFESIPKAWKEDIIKNGITLNMRDNLGVLEQYQSSRTDDFHHGDEVRSWECKVNDYNFRLISSVSKIRKFARNLFMLNILSSEEIKAHDTAFFTIERNGRYLGCIWVKGKTVKNESFVEYRNSILLAKCRIAFLAWVKRNGLELSYFPKNEDTFAALSQDFTVEKVDKDKWENMSLMDMVKLPPESIPSGFYLSYYRKLVECSLMRPKPPALDDDEREYLAKKFVWGKPIFDAAFSGHAEAEYVMSLFYRDGIGTACADYRRSEKWYHQAIRDGWLAVAPAKKDVMYRK